MNRRRNRLITAVALLSFSAGSARAETWMKSKLTRFGVEFNHPASFRREQASWEKPGFEGSISAGNTDTMTDGTMSVILRGEPGCDRQSFESQWNHELRERGDCITYKVKRDNWYVVSGVESDGSEFYTKSWLLTNGGFRFEAVYPHSRSTTCSRVLERMLEGFSPSVTEGEDTFSREPVPSGGIGQDEAVRIVAGKLDFKPAKHRYLLFDHTEKLAGRHYLVVHGYDLVIDSPAGDGHTATFGWYYVDALTGAAFNATLGDDNLLPIKPLTFR